MAEPLQELGDHIAQATGDAVMAAYVRLGELMLDDHGRTGWSR